MHVCGHMHVSADKQVILSVHSKHMTILALHLKAIIHARKCEGTGCKSEEAMVKMYEGNWRMRERGIELSGRE